MEIKVVVVTGAGKGIGKEIAKAFAAENFQVVIADIDELLGKQVEEEILSHKQLAVFLKVDVSIVEEINLVVNEVYERFGRIDILINNAGISQFHPAFELDENSWDKVIDTNLKSVFFCSQAVAKLMKEKGGAIVNIASTRALMSEPNS